MLLVAALVVPRDALLSATVASVVTVVVVVPAAAFELLIDESPADFRGGGRERDAMV